MANDEDLRDDRIGRQRSRRNGTAVTRLCRAWLRAGADAFSGSMRVAADAADDMTLDDCAPDATRRKERDR